MAPHVSRSNPEAVMRALVTTSNIALLYKILCIVLGGSSCSTSCDFIREISRIVAGQRLIEVFHLCSVCVVMLI